MPLSRKPNALNHYTTESQRVETNGRVPTDGGDCITCLANAVGKIVSSNLRSRSVGFQSCSESLCRCGLLQPADCAVLLQVRRGTSSNGH